MNKLLPTAAIALLSVVGLNHAANAQSLPGAEYSVKTQDGSFTVKGLVVYNPVSYQMQVTARGCDFELAKATFRSSSESVDIDLGTGPGTKNVQMIKIGFVPNRAEIFGLCKGGVGQNEGFTTTVSW